MWVGADQRGLGSGQSRERGASTHRHQPVAAGWDVSGEKPAGMGCLVSPARKYQPIESSLCSHGMRGPGKHRQDGGGQEQVHFYPRQGMA